MIAQAGGPPDTSAYYHVAYAWVAAVYVAYSVLLWVRGRAVKRRLESTETRRTADPSLRS